MPSKSFLKDWNPIQYFIGIQSAYVKCDILYNNPQTNDRITVQISMFTDIENAYTTFEQNQEGNELKIGETVAYQTTNEDKNAITWLEKNCIWSCNGYIDETQLWSFVEYLIKGG